MPDYNIFNFGARGDGHSDDQFALQGAINACSSAGGGRVCVPGGHVFRTSAIQLKANVELHLEHGARLQALDGLTGYPPHLALDVLTGGTVVEDDLPKAALITAYQADNIAISGGGVIDGNGRSFVEADLGYIYKMRGERQYLERPFTLFLVGCRNLDLRDVTLHDGAFWTVRLTGCEDVTIHGLRIDNDLKLPNNDGIDLDRCHNVRISDCDIRAGDDAICLKACRGSAGYGACEAITVTGCTLTSTSSALKIGNECCAPIRNVVFNSCIIRSSHRGLSIHLGEEGLVENVIFANMVIETRLFNPAWWGRGEPVYISAAPWTEQHRVGKVRQIRFSNLLCRSENGIFIQGWEPGLVEDVTLENVRVEVDKWSNVAGGMQDMRPCPGEGLLRHDTAGFYIRNAANVTLRDCQTAWGQNRPAYFSHAIETHQTPGLVLQNFKGEAAFTERNAAIFSD